MRRYEYAGIADALAPVTEQDGGVAAVAVANKLKAMAPGFFRFDKFLPNAGVPMGAVTIVDGHFTEDQAVLAEGGVGAYMALNDIGDDDAHEFDEPEGDVDEHAAEATQI